MSSELALVALGLAPALLPVAVVLALLRIVRPRQFREVLAGYRLARAELGAAPPG